ncbi:MAG: DUF262 domain-containing protein [Staphylococcus xylosus]|uniref:DUF262 domain-containing protein n=1 Tax=Staphylococcus xylosus TaxID=1288 RepID=UPI003F54E2B4|nr:DUF262 domain-containing protein [Staphylococcus xylosus]
MGFNTENRSILEFFQKSVVYIVPRYQRSYVWKETNWSELLTDITFTMNTGSRASWSHFLGTIVLNDINKELKNSKDPGVTYYEIIDGQQRITTIYIIFAAIVKHFNSLEDEKESERAKYVKETFLTTLKSTNEKITKLNNPDATKDIQSLLDYVSYNSKNELSKSNRFYQVFMYFISYIENKSFDDTVLFLNKLLEINIVEIISGEEEEIYNIFEVLNARGQKLKQMELLKNHIMKYVQPRTDDFIDHSKDKWNGLMNMAKGLSDIDNLINHFAKCYIKKRSENINSVYKLIKEEVPINQLSNLLDDLYDFTEVYMQVNDVNNPDFIIEYFNIKRNQQIRSLLAAIKLLTSKNIINNSTEEKAFKNIRNFFFIFNGMQQTSNQTDKIIGSTSYSIYHCTTDAEFKIIMTDFFIKMSKYIEKNKFLTLMSNNQSFKYSNKDKSLKRNNKLVKYTLVANAQYNQQDTYIMLKDMTIEHLLPDNGNSETTAFGNLTIVTASLNSDNLSNKPITQKIDILNNESTIKDNYNIEEYYNYETDKFDYVSREKDIFENLYENVFPYNPYIYGINETQIKTYYDNYELVKSDNELLEILKLKGIHFENFLKNNPLYIEQYKNFRDLL